MDRISKFFIRRPTLFWSLMVGLIIYGVMSYLRMPKLEDPAVVIKQFSVVAIYPGADAHTVELEVAIPLEDALRTLPDVEKIKTDVSAGQAVISVEFLKEMPQEEVEQHFDMARRKMADMEMKLPSGAMKPIVVDDMMDVYGLFYGFYGEGYTYDDLEKYAKLLRRELLTVPGVKRVNIGGVQSEVIDIELTPEYIKSNGLIPTQLMMALQNTTGPVNAGKTLSGSNRISLEVTEGAQTVEDIENILINTPQGKKVRLGDIATVRRHYAEPRKNAVFIDHIPALTIAITLESSAIVPDVGKAVDKKLTEVMKQFPVGMQTEKIFFQPDKVDEAIHGFMLNLLESVLIVVLILMLSMGLKSGIIIGFGLILTLALSFPILAACHTTLQRISLGAFIVAMGMLVDNSVVVMDGILADRDRGMAPSTYLYRIVKNTAWPLLGATLIAACTFLPIYITPGTAGEFAGDLFVVICVSLLSSWFLAIVQVPFCANAWLKPRKEKKDDKKKKKGVANNLAGRLMSPVVRWILHHRVISVACAVGLLVAASLGLSKIKNIFFPDFDYKQFIVECYFPNTTDAAEVESRILSLADSVGKLDEVERVVVTTGGTPARYSLVRPMPQGGDNYAELIIDCKDFRTMLAMTDTVRRLARRLEPEAYIRTRKYNLSISSSHTVEVEFSGPDVQVLRNLAAKAEAVMKASPLIDPYSVQNNWNAPAPRLQFDFSQADASRAGVSRDDIGNALQAATDGYPVGVIYDNDRIVPIRVAMRNPDGSKPTPLTSIPVWTMANISVDKDKAAGLATGAVSPDQIINGMFRTTVLANVVDSASLKFADDYVYRYNGQRAIQVEADPNPYDPEVTPAKAVDDIAPALDSIPLPPGYSMRWVGEMETSGYATDTLVGFLPMILMMVFLILLILFNNWKKIIVILLCFPFVICGIVPMLLLTDTPFTFIAIVGCMGLIGMMVKNAIVLVDEINRLQEEEHAAPYDAVVRSTLSRVRPVMLASFTTILGMIPLISDAMYGSLAVTVIGGLFVGTIVTLMVLPLLYSIFFNVKDK